MATSTASITAQNTGTDWIEPNFKVLEFGYLNMSISGTFAATIYLQRTFDNGTTAKDVASYTSGAEKNIIEYETGVKYRLFCKTGGFTSGTANVRLSN